MAKNKEIKTNAMRILDRMKIPYEHYTYECSEFIDGMQIVEKLGLDAEKVYKTLVTQGNAKEYFVFVIPVAKELDMKKAAKAVGQKSVAMIHVKEITQITGYVRRIGSQLELSPADLAKAAQAFFAPVIAEETE